MRRRPVPILMYHVINSPPPGTPFAGLWVAPADLRAQLRALAGAGYRGVTLDTVLAAWRGSAALPKHPIVVSFDDGYRSQATSGRRILRSFGWPGVLNLAWHNLDTPGMVTDAEVRALIRDGWEIDPHSVTHADLTTLDAARLRREVAGSRRLIRERFGVPADAFCYPAGRFDAAVAAAARAAGYRAATTVEPGVARPTGDPFTLPRIRVQAGDGATTVLDRVRAAVGSAA
jgi:peptidoglycan/xylan/chitin deacetylase (PgdA/CDA1 family)